VAGCPADPTYDSVRKVFNGMIDKRPAIIAQTRSAQDVSACVQFARARGIPISVRGGGHSFSGKSVVEGGLMIDLSLMKEIAVDPANRIARAQTGLKLGEFDRATQKYGLVTPLGIATTTGISGLTLGGGYGWLVGKYGLSCDNVTWMEVVTADGQVLECSEHQNSELFWGMRGAGANLGIATQIEYRLHPLTHVYGGPVFHKLSADVMRFYSEFANNQPDELTTLGAATIGPDGKPAFVIAACYCGSSASEATKLIEPVRQFAPPLLDMAQERPYLEMQSLFDADNPPGRRYYNKSHNVSEFKPGMIDTVLQFTATMTPYPSMIGFQQLHGEGSRKAVSACAFPHRKPHHVVWISPVQDDPAKDGEIVQWTRDCWDAMRPHVDQAVYVNAVVDDSGGQSPAQEVYGVNHERLRLLKKKYDPTNFLAENSNILPAL
jgi:UDP-N-acetylenolpyruvoylglucosamine reductase